MIVELERIWKLLEDDSGRAEVPKNHTYRRLDIENESGLRLGIASPSGSREFLVELDGRDRHSLSPPSWTGMGFETIVLDVPRQGTRHIRIHLEDRQFQDIFSSVCADLAEILMNVTVRSSRSYELQNCLDRWDQFFKRHGAQGLSTWEQQGLYGELKLLKLLIDLGVGLVESLESWKVGEVAYHDFEVRGLAIEVKTTTSKEPRRVQINNEIQLDNRGHDLALLHVLTLHKVDTDGETLGELVSNIGTALDRTRPGLFLFERKLRDAGYLSIHETLYIDKYVVRKIETFEIQEGFPRLVHLPPGVGNVTYTLDISACSRFEVDIVQKLAVTMQGE
jgi:hypothetical protein